MCRLLGYVTSGRNLSLQDVLGTRVAEQYRRQSMIHNDGWGCALISEPEVTRHVADGGARTPETATRIYKSTVAARFDQIYQVASRQGARGAIYHLRLASSGLPLIIENQQPFFCDDLSFMHNGDISSAVDGRNIVSNKDFPVDREILAATGGRSDSAIYFALILERVRRGCTLADAVSQAVGQLRAEYPLCSFNCMLQSADELVVLRSCARTEVSKRVTDLYASYGMEQYAHDYRVIRYRKLSAGGVVAASSGFDQPEEYGWAELPNDTMIVASNRTGEFRLRSL